MGAQEEALTCGNSLNRNVPCRNEQDRVRLSTPRIRLTLLCLSVLLTVLLKRTTALCSSVSLLRGPTILTSPRVSRICLVHQ
jgi:hypothetical protein